MTMRSVGIPARLQSASPNSGSENRWKKEIIVFSRTLQISLIDSNNKEASCSEILINRGEGEIPRRLTPRECARLQGFPDSFKIVVSDTQDYKQFGNSVVVPLMTAVAETVVAKMNELEKAID